ncbi:Hypothetical predicted protein [Mytilus galloprovincialis]|uniref:G-protein coupled receptors family 1 profile domain-containing protein n=1 Tax=Mytilus galloprovincialis TaxID=29158 RepID=A0A8B6H5G1_MYTGA|nr:Hypothetical predicted protein [Mytilus galloprovincialis]
MCMNLNHSKKLLFKRLSLVLATLLSVIVALPIPFVHEIIPVHNYRYNITGMRCGSSPKGNNLARNVYVITVGVFGVTIGTTFIALYSKIAYKMFVHFKSSSNQNDKKVKEIKVEANDRGNKDPANYKTNQEHSTDYDYQVNSNENDSNTPIISKQTGSAKRREKDRGITYRMAIMFIVITLIFFISYTPKLVMNIISGIYKDFAVNLSTSQRTAIMFVNDMFIINNIVNPFIYAFMDTKFRKEAKTLLKRAFDC